MGKKKIEIQTCLIQTCFNYTLRERVKFFSKEDAGLEKNTFYCTERDQETIKQTLKEFSRISTSSLNDARYEKIKIITLTKEKKYDDDQLILDCTQKEEQYFIKTGLFAGTIFYKGIEFNIVPHCNEKLFSRMLDSCNQIFVERKNPEKGDNSNNNYFEKILIYLFVSALDKAKISGFPAKYDMQKQQQSSFRGRLNTNAHIKKDIPYRGKLSVIFPERKFDQDIINVLFQALKIAKKSKVETVKVGRLMNLFAPYATNKFCSKNIIKKAQNSKALQNPIYASFKKVLNYAELILTHKNLSPAKDNKEIYGYLIDVSVLWETYLENLFRQNLQDYHVVTQEEIETYSDTFFEKKIIPDIVLKKDDVYAVFDAKFKKMTGNKEDVDREDFYQIHSYASYYQTKHKLKACGLLYPLEKTLEPDKQNTDNFWSSSQDIKFTIDGISSVDDEKKFFERIEVLLKE